MGLVIPPKLRESLREEENLPVVENLQVEENQQVVENLLAVENPPLAENQLPENLRKAVSANRKVPKGQSRGLQSTSLTRQSF